MPGMPAPGPASGSRRPWPWIPGACAGSNWAWGIAAWNPVSSPTGKNAGSTDGLNAGKRPKVVVTINGSSYRSTVAVMGGRFMVVATGRGVPAPEIKAVLESLDLPRLAGLAVAAAAVETRSPGSQR